MTYEVNEFSPQMWKIAKSLGNWDTRSWTKPLPVRLLSLKSCQLEGKRRLRQSHFVGHLPLGWLGFCLFVRDLEDPSFAAEQTLIFHSLRSDNENHNVSGKSRDRNAQ